MSTRNTWNVTIAQYVDGKPFGPASDRRADKLLATGVSVFAADELLRRNPGATATPEPDCCRYCDSTEHLYGECIGADCGTCGQPIAGTGPTRHCPACNGWTEPETAAQARERLNRCTAIDGCTKQSLPGSMLCADHVLAAAQR